MILRTYISACARVAAGFFVANIQNMHFALPTAPIHAQTVQRSDVFVRHSASEFEQHSNTKQPRETTPPPVELEHPGGCPFVIDAPPGGCVRKSVIATPHEPMKALPPHGYVYYKNKQRRRPHIHVTQTILFNVA